MMSVDGAEGISLVICVGLAQSLLVGKGDVLLLLVVLKQQLGCFFIDH